MLDSGEVVSEERMKRAISVASDCIDGLRNQFGNSFNNKFASGKTDQNGMDTGMVGMIKSWGEAFIEEGITPTQVKRGLASLRRSRYVPNLGEFLEACAPSVDIDSALREAVEQMRRRDHGKDVWSHPSIYWAAAKIGKYDLLANTHTQLLPRFKQALQEVKDAGTVPPVPQRFDALAAPGQSETDRETGRANVARINEQASALSRSRGGSRDWAARIVREERERPGTHDDNKLRIARQALGQE